MPTTRRVSSTSGGGAPSLTTRTIVSALIGMLRRPNNRSPARPPNACRRVARRRPSGPYVGRVGPPPLAIFPCRQPRESSLRPVTRSARRTSSPVCSRLPQLVRDRDIPGAAHAVPDTGRDGSRPARQPWTLAQVPTTGEHAILRRPLAYWRYRDRLLGQPPSKTCRSRAAGAWLSKYR